MEQWREYAACREVGPEWFFPERGDSTEMLAVARKICARCEVRMECLEYAMRVEDVRSTRHGMYGGMSAKQRIKLAKLKNWREGVLQ